MPCALAQMSVAQPYPEWSVSHGNFPYNDRRVLVEPEAGMVSPFSALITTTDLLTDFDLVQFRELDYETKKCFPDLRISEGGTETVVIARVGSTIDVRSLAAGAKDNLRRFSELYSNLPCLIDNPMGQLTNFRCESGMYHAFLLACSQRRTRRVAR